VNFTKPVAVFIARVLAFAVADGFVTIAPSRQAIVDVIFIGHHQRARNDRLGDDGLIVCCLTSGSILMTTWPPRSIIPSTGGFSFSSVPRPRFAFQPASASARPFFFHGFGMPLVTGDDVDFVTFNRAFQLGLRFETTTPVRSWVRHLVNIVLVEIEFLRDLLVRQVESHQIQA